MNYGGKVMDKELKVLKTLNEGKNLSQRQISKSTEMSLGKINEILKELTRDEYIICTKKSRGFDYKVTIKGMKVLEENLKEVDGVKIRLHREVAMVKQAVILGAGSRKEFGKPTGFLELKDETVIDRIIELLKDRGIEDITIVVGYESSYYKDYCKAKNIKLVENPKFKWTGTMASLALAKDYIKGDFLLIENDLVFEERAIKEVLKNSARDCVLITNESGSGDEAFVEIRNGFLYKISKDKHMFNKIDGEMIGISKLSYEAFNKMLKEYERYNKNPYLNYEYALLDVARYYDIGYTKIDDLVWAEIDSKDHYHNVVNHVYPKLRRKELEIKTISLRKYVVEALNVNEDSIGEIVPAGGMTNKNYKVSINNKNYILRVPGAGTEEMISRKDEKINAEIGFKLGLDTHVLCFDEVKGIKISEFIENAETLTGTSASKESNMKMTTKLLKTLHNSDVKLNNSFDILGKIKLYEDLLEKANGRNFDDYEEIRAKVIPLKELLVELGAKEVPAHNDTVPENFVKSGDDKMYLIDWEYSGMNDPMWDLAAHIIECNFSEDDEELFLRTYFEEDPDLKIKKRILIHKIFQDLLWSIWTKLKEAKGDDFGTYGIDRYNRAKKNLEILHQMLL